MNFSRIFLFTHSYILAVPGRSREVKEGECKDEYYYKVVLKITRIDILMRV